ncbi:MAG: glycosyltransferase family 4 protein [Deltaproteobacteria bacterium]|nr:glycosyltransferase family 4 protein [Deltaproteobacteria bacterium]
MPARVLHLTRDLPPRSAGGVSSAVGGWVAAAVTRGDPVAVISFDAWRPTSTAAATYERSERDNQSLLRVHNRPDTGVLASFARDFAPDVIWIHDGRLAPFAPPIAPRVQVVHVLSHLQDRLRAAPPTATTIALTAALEAADGVVVTTRAARELLLADHPGLAARTTIVPLVPTLPVYPRAPDASSGPIVVVGRFDVLKGTDLIVKALSQLVAHRPVVLAGGVPENAAAERRWAARLAGAELVGWLAPDALAALFATAAIMLAPSRLETCGLAVLEAVRAGVPVVASDIPAHREVAPDARFFASGDAHDLARAVGLVFAPESR